MTTKLFNVSLYREARYAFKNVEAESPEGAIAICEANTHDESSHTIEECEGSTIASLVDVVGDDDFTDSKIVDVSRIVSLDDFRIYENAKQLLASIARMKIDGEPEENEDGSAEPFEMGCDDSIDALRELIEEARIILHGDSAGPRWQVQQLIGSEWQNTWHEDAGEACADQPLTFETYEEAQDAIDDHLATCAQAVARGDMADHEEADEFRITAA